MSGYNNMSVDLGEAEEPLETDIDNDTVTEPAEPAETGESESGNETPNSDETQLTGMLTVVWVLLIIGVIVFVASTIIKKRAAEEVNTVYVSVPANMYSMSELSAEAQHWTDYLQVSKQVQTNGSTTAFYLSGEAKNYGKPVSIPVSYEEFSSVAEGSTIEFVFSRLYIEGQEYIVIRRWSVYAT